MNKTATNITSISQGSLQDLYLQRSPFQNHLLLQILAFQPSEFNPKEIILRISDKTSFIDCLLVGPYIISNSKIVTVEYSHSAQSFRPLDIIKIADYFCKVDPTKICNLKMIIRKIEEHAASKEILGRPEEISQFVENNYQKKQVSSFSHTFLLSAGTQDIPIKIEENSDFVEYSAPNSRNQVQPAKITEKTSSNHNNERTSSSQEQTLTLEDIMNSKPGFFIGRLVRYKFGSKQAKDGPMSFLYLGFLDINGEIVRVNLAGRIAIKQSRELKKGKVYYIKGLELFQGQKTKGTPQIRLKEKDYRIQEIQNEVIKSQYRHSYFRWEHESEWIESEMVDIIGIVEDIEEKTSYKNVNTFQEQRDVVRLIVRNAFKTVRINFWADHINILNSLSLKKKQAIVLEDIKKKKSIFLDYMAESNIIMLDEDSQMLQQFGMFLPPAQEAPEPNNIKQLLEVYELEPFNMKVRVINVTIAHISSKLIYYKMCNNCKKKVEKILESCLECSQNSFSYKYNCSIDISDSSGSISCIAFDNVCEKLLGKTAEELNLLGEQQIKELIEVKVYQEYRVSVQNKNNRKILRSMQKLMTNSDILCSSNNNLSLIKEIQVLNAE